MDAYTASCLRRRFLKIGITGIGVALMTPFLNCASAQPRLGRGGVAASSFGAKADGKTDDTDAIQKALDSLGASGGDVHLGPGTHMIDARKSIQMRARTRLLMDPDSVLKCIPNALGKYAVISVQKVSAVQIVGGTILGDRNDHQGADGEWGHGIAILSSENVTIDGTSVSDCWGDGVYIGPSDSPDGCPSSNVLIDNVVSRRNRRQGLSLTAVRKVTVRGSTFSDTKGTAPACGIDIEPGKKASASDIRIEHCRCLNNEGSGITFDENVSGVFVDSTTVSGNRGYGMLITAASGVEVRDSQFEKNALAAIKVRHGATNGRIERNTLQGNYASSVRRAVKVLSGQSSASAQIEVDSDSSSVLIVDNAES